MSSLTVRAVTVDDGAVLFDPATQHFFDLNESAAELWIVVSAASFSRPALVDHLVEQYSIDIASAQQIVDGFIRDLEVGGLMVSTTD